MKFSDYFRKNFETSDNTTYPELETRYYRNKLDDGLTALKEMIAEVGAVIIDENADYLEILFETSNYSCTAKITVTTAVEIGIDFNIITYNFLGMGKGLKYISSFYEILNKKLSLKGTCLYRG